MDALAGSPRRFARTAISVYLAKAATKTEFGGEGNMATAWRIVAVAFSLAVALATATSAAAQTDGGAAPMPPEPPGATGTASAAGAGSGVDSGGDPTDVLNLIDRPLESLINQSVVATAPAAMAMPVTTVARNESTVGKSPAAIYVVTNEMIRRSGARSIPEILRLVPGVSVARVDSSRYAVSIRGSNNQFADKLLVQIDGRSVYSPLFAGVYWDAQDVLLEDVDRIEVIRGPGATVWGANAVNGIINIITKSSRDTTGVFAEGGAGSEEHGFASARVGGELADGLTYRIYGKWFDRDDGFDPAGFVEDDWRQQRGGFRVDWEASDVDTLTVQGDAYAGASDITTLRPAFPPIGGLFAVPLRGPEHISGANTLIRWRRDLGDGADWRLQAYYDHAVRDSTTSSFRMVHDTVDVDFQHHFHANDVHEITWGFGYRNVRDDLGDAPFWIELTPSRRAVDVFSYFVEDQITLVEDRCYLTIGSKFEHNDFTSFEFQPSARLLWTPDERQSIWAAISRAVRTPSRVNDDIFIVVPTSATLPVFATVSGNRAIESEDLLAYEIGMRRQETDRWFWDLAAFYYQYNELVGTVAQPPVIGFPTLIPSQMINARDAHAYGFEIASDYTVTPCWKLRGGYSFLRFVFDASPIPFESEVPELEGSSPRNQLFVQSGWDLGCAWKLDVAWRYVDTLPSLGVPSYNALDARLAWEPTRNLELAVVGRHLLDDHHLEFPASPFTGGFGTLVQHEVYAVATWRY